jgi:hypothetical protein
MMTLPERLQACRVSRDGHVDFIRLGLQGRNDTETDMREGSHIASFLCVTLASLSIFPLWPVLGPCSFLPLALDHQLQVGLDNLDGLGSTGRTVISHVWVFVFQS